MEDSLPIWEEISMKFDWIPKTFFSARILFQLNILVASRLPCACLFLCFFVYLGSVRSPTRCTPLCLGALIMYLGHRSVIRAETFQHCTMQAMVDRGATSQHEFGSRCGVVKIFQPLINVCDVFFEIDIFWIDRCKPVLLLVGYWSFAVALLYSLQVDDFRT